jgi:hypothetical protein
MGTPLLVFVVKSGSVLLSLSLSLASSAFLVALNNFLQKRNRLLILDFPTKDVFQHLVVNRIKEFPHVAFECIALAGIILARCTKHVSNFLHTFVSAFADTARIRVIDKSRLKYFVQHRKGRMMEHTISDNRLMYPSDLRIMYPKSLVWPVLIRLVLQIAIQIKNILLDMEFKLSNIGLIPFVGLKYFPSSE